MVEIHLWKYVMNVFEYFMGTEKNVFYETVILQTNIKDIRIFTISDI